MNIAIIGEGIVSAIGNTKEQVLRSLLGRKSGIGEMQYLQSVHHELPVGEVKLSNEELKRLLFIPEPCQVSRTALMGMFAIEQAFLDAGINMDDSLLGRGIFKEPIKTVLISGTTVGGMDITENHFGHDALKKHDCGSSTSQMAKGLFVFDEASTISTACSSAANAIMLGARMLENGEADIVVAGGTEALTRFHLNGFNSLMILDHKRCRPFDATRAGLNLGEGAAYIVMTSEKIARQLKVIPHAYITGWGNACDAFHQTASSENGEGAYLAMKAALEKAHLSAEDIQYVNAHGTGTPNNDPSEVAALRRIFGEQMPRVSSTKSFTGHTTSASGGIETVICLLAMQHHFVPSNLGWKKPMENGFKPSRGEKNVQLNHVLCNSFGFGGNDTSLVLSARPTRARTNDVLPKNSIGNLADIDFAKLGIKVLSKVEINDTERLVDIRKYVKPLEARRMGKLMKSSLLSSLEALEQAGIECPDAIITGTAYGCLENSEKLLLQMQEEGEAMLKPTYFMQSTHNTISGNIAIKTHCHGYNVTYTQGKDSLAWCERDAVMLLKSGKVKNVLVGCHDESTPLFDEIMKGEQYKNSLLKEGETVHSVAMVLSCGE